MVHTDKYNPQNKFFLESSIIERNGALETESFQKLWSSVLSPPGEPTHVHMGLSVKLPLPTLSGWGFLKKQVLVGVFPLQVLSGVKEMGWGDWQDWNPMQCAG